MDEVIHSLSVPRTYIFQLSSFPGVKLQGRTLMARIMSNVHCPCTSHCNKPKSQNRATLSGCKFLVRLTPAPRQSGEQPLRSWGLAVSSFHRCRPPTALMTRSSQHRIHSLNSLCSPALVHRLYRADHQVLRNAQLPLCMCLICTPLTSQRLQGTN